MVRNDKGLRNQKHQPPMSSLPPLIRNPTRTMANQSKSRHHRHHLLRRSQNLQSKRASLVPRLKNHLRRKSTHRCPKDRKSKSRSPRILRLWVTGKSVEYAPGNAVPDPILIYLAGENESHALTYFRTSKAVPEHCSVSDNIQ